MCRQGLQVRDALRWHEPLRPWTAVDGGQRGSAEGGSAFFVPLLREPLLALSISKCAFPFLDPFVTPPLNHGRNFFNYA